MALVERRADYRGATRARACLTGIGPRAGIAVVTARAVGRIRVRAYARRRIAGARHMALVERRADYRGATRARACLTGIGPRAGIAVVTARAVGRIRVRAYAR